MYSQILNYLYQKYFVDFSSHSDVTSSYWKLIGSQSVQCVGTSYKLKGFAFGDYMPSRFTSYARALPQFLSSRGLAKKYDCLADVWEVGCKVAKEHERILLFDCAKQMLTLSFLLKSLKIKS